MSSKSQDRIDVGAFLAGVAVGAAVGAGMALLYAPQSGERTRGKLRRAAEDMEDAAREKARYAAEDARRVAEDARNAAQKSGERVKRGVEEGRERLNL